MAKSGHGSGAGDIGRRTLPFTSSVRAACRRWLCALALVSCVVAALGCGGQLRQIRNADLHDVPRETLPQGRSAVPAKDYVGVVSPKSAWRVYSSLESPTSVCDDDPASAATTAADHGSDQWLLLDLGQPCRFQVVQQHHPEGLGHAERYRIDAAGPTGFPWRLVWVGPGAAGESSAVLRRPVEARFLRITVLEEGSPRWGISELEVF